MDAKLARCSPKDSDVQIAIDATTGNPSLRIIEQVLAADHDLVVATTDEDHATH